MEAVDILTLPRQLSPPFSQRILAVAMQTLVPKSHRPYLGARFLLLSSNYLLPLQTSLST
ncbi:hypothetical protein Hanom_Chr09g00827431 [Helianthus anomalus]